jgi:hypothetical protein
MTLLVGATGWSLFAFAALVHLVHYRRFQNLVSLHLRHSRSVTLGVVLAEAILAIVIPIAYGLGLTALLVAACLLAALLGGGFALWVGRLVLSGSQLTCACSYSAEPAAPASLARSLGTLAVLAFAFADHSGVATDLATIAVGAAVGVACFTLPDALTWPASSRELRQELVS